MTKPYPGKMCVPITEDCDCYLITSSCTASDP